MKAILLVLVSLIVSAYATSLDLLVVTMPIYLSGSDMDRIWIMKTPVMSASSSESSYSAICHAFIPPNVSSWIKPKNINIAFQYGISVSLDYGSEKDKPHWVFTVDASAAKVPEGYPFTIEQVADSVVTCVKMMTPTVPENERKITIKVLLPAKK